MNKRDVLNILICRGFGVDEEIKTSFNDEIIKNNFRASKLSHKTVSWKVLNVIRPAVMIRIAVIIFVVWINWIHCAVSSISCLPKLLPNHIKFLAIWTRLQPTEMGKLSHQDTAHSEFNDS